MPRHIDEHGACENCMCSAIYLHTAGNNIINRSKKPEILRAYSAIECGTSWHLLFISVTNASRSQGAGSHF